MRLRSPSGEVEDLERAELLDRIAAATLGTQRQMETVLDGLEAVHLEARQHAARLEARIALAERRAGTVVGVATAVLGAGIAWTAYRAGAARDHAEAAGVAAGRTLERVEHLERLVRAADARTAKGFTGLLGATQH